MKYTRKYFVGILAAMLMVVLGYVIYVFTAYYRLEDRVVLPVEGQDASTAQVSAGEIYTVLSYNLGFGAYSADYSFFMDGGQYSRAFSREAVETNIAQAAETARERQPDFLLFQEVDVEAVRSYHVDELEQLRTDFQDFVWVFAQNYDSPYLFWPLTSPHGASRSGIATFSKWRIDSSLRRRLPVEAGVAKFLDLDRCYSVSRLPVEGGKTLCLYNVHLSAYTSDGSIATEQLELLLADMEEEYAAGNYVVCGGDFNKDLLGDSAAVFGVFGESQTWAQPFPVDLLPEEIQLCAPMDVLAPVPSCRNTDTAYEPGKTFVLTVDGFLVSDNVEAISAEVVDTGFAWSDHNPVELTFSLH